MGGFEPADWDGDAETLPQLREIQAEWSSEDFDRTFMNREEAFWAAVSVTGANAETAEILRGWPWGIPKAL